MSEKFDTTKQDNQPNIGNERLHLTTEIATEKDWEDYKKIRLEAIEKEPMAFYATKNSKEKEYNRSDEEWKSDLANTDAFVTLSKNNSVPVGMVQAISKIENKTQWHIRGVYLNKNFRGGGYGREMMNLILNEIKRRGGKKVTLNVMDTQDIARKIYEKLDFKISKKFKPEIIDGIKYPGGQWMEKEI